MDNGNLHSHGNTSWSDSSQNHGVGVWTSNPPTERQSLTTITQNTTLKWLWKKKQTMNEFGEHSQDQQMELEIGEPPHAHIQEMR